MNNQSEPSAADEWQDRSMSAVCQFGAILNQLCKSNPWPERPALPLIVNHLMTELWDQGFSQTQIREAFEATVADMPRYAVGKEVRP